MERLKKALISALNMTESEREERENRSSDLLDAILKILLSILTIYIITREIIEPSVLLSDAVLYVTDGLLFLSYFFLRKKKFLVAAVFTIVVTFSGMTFIAFTNSGVRDIGVISYFLLVVFSALLLGWPASLAVSLFSILAIIGMVICENMGFIVYRTHSVALIGRDLAFFIVATLALTIFYDKVLNRYIGEINNSRREYLQVNEELTERNNEIMKINEELIKARDKARESDRLKTSFLTNLSHEIRTPMNGIVGFSELIISPDVPLHEKNEYNSIIANSCRQLLGVVNDIIDISKIESGIIELHNEAVNLNKLMEDVYSLHLHSAKEKGIKYELFKGVDEQSSQIITDEVKLYQVLNNLVGNAVKFTERGSITLKYEIKCRHIEFSVIDTGIGIASEKQDVVFERFIQEDSSHTRKYGGTGLGLSIAKAYVEKMGGRIWLQSEPNVGSSFYFMIPYEPAPVKDNTGHLHAKTTTTKKVKVLLVEDVDMNEILLRRLLKKYEFEIISAQTGEQALDLFYKTTDLDIILMDIKLPDIDGYEVTRIIRKHNNLLPVVAQTAYAFAEEHQKAIDAGCNEVLTKPITQEALDEVICKFLE